MSHKVFIVPDLQVPYQDTGFVNAMAQAISDLKGPGDRVCSIGDEMDMQTISRWAEGTPLAHQRSIGNDRDETKSVLRDLQVTDMIRSNHTDRLHNYVMKNAPGLLGLPELGIRDFFGLEELGITFHERGWRFAPGWIALHGDEAGSSQIAGTTSGNLSKKTGLSVVCGHSHRLGMQPTTLSVNGAVTRLMFGIEVGHAMDIRKATYARTHNWQQGWAVMHVNGKHVVPELMPVVNRRFNIMGKQYSW